MLSSYFITIYSVDFYQHDARVDYIGLQVRILVFVISFVSDTRFSDQFPLGAPANSGVNATARNPPGHGVSSRRRGGMEVRARRDWRTGTSSASRRQVYGWEDGRSGRPRCVNSYY